MPEITEIVVVAEAATQQSVRALLAGIASDKQTLVVLGGETRQESVSAGLAALSTAVVSVLVHDGARPLIRPEDVRRGMRIVAPGRAAILAAPVVDTVKVVDDRGHITRTLDRAALWSAQTPQFAMLADMRRAHLEAGRAALVATDDASLLERCGIDVVVVPGYADNFKITTPGDLARAEAILRRREPVLPSEEEVLVIEAFIPQPALAAILSEIEHCDGDVDGIDRDLPQAIAVRAYLPASRLERFRVRFVELAGAEATFTTRFSHAMARA